MSRDNPLLDLWRMADDQWAREWARNRDSIRRDGPLVGMMRAAEARGQEWAERVAPTFGLLLIAHQPPMGDTGDERHGDWEYGTVGR
jgi:hypothetical protein